MEEIEELKITRDDFREKALSMPGAISSIFVLAILIPALSLFPSNITVAMFVAFSVPTFYVFIIRTIFNREIGIKKHLTLTVFLSYLLYMFGLSAWETAAQFYVHSFFFVIGMGFGALTYLTYWIIYKIGKATLKEELSYRKRFFFIFIPTTAIMLFISIMLSSFLGEFSFSLTEVLVNGV